MDREPYSPLHRTDICIIQAGEKPSRLIKSAHKSLILYLVNGDARMPLRETRVPRGELSQKDATAGCHGR